VRALAVVLLLAGGTFVRAADGDPSRSSTGEKLSSQAADIRLVRSASDGRFCYAETPNFRVFWSTEESDLRALAERCEQLAATSKQAWLGKDQASLWTPKCDVVVHAEMAAYIQAMGPASEQTSGCATIRLDGGRVVVRRIDLRADALDWRSETLPHELTHVILANRFSRTRISPWADEGIAMLGETPEKLKRRLADLRGVAAVGTVYTVGDLMNVRTCPDPAYRAAFYGQSLALVSLLLDSGSRRQLLQFVETSQSKGVEAALHDVYGIREGAEFERHFRQYQLTERPLAWSNQKLVADAAASHAGTMP
jgi:hypothetical protein